MLLGSINPYRPRWREVDVMIIDEISMVSGELFDGMEAQVAQIRYGQNGGMYRPFGGVQLIVCGVCLFLLRRCSLCRHLVSLRTFSKSLPLSMNSPL